MKLTDKQRKEIEKVLDRTCYTLPSWTDEDDGVYIDDWISWEEMRRIIEIIDIGNGNLVYYTKGDANESPDGYTIEYKDMIGTVLTRIKYIGIPSVLIGETIK